MNRHSQHSQRAFWPCLLLLAISALFSGCDTTEEARVSNKGDIRNIMNALTLAAGEPEVASELFAEGAAPDSDWFEFIKGKLIETDEVTLGDNEATVTFTVETNAGDIEADCEWKLVNQDGRWLISEAPVTTP